MLVLIVNPVPGSVYPTWIVTTLQSVIGTYAQQPSGDSVADGQLLFNQPNDSIIKSSMVYQ
jgi:hypothetical protein